MSVKLRISVTGALSAWMLLAPFPARLSAQSYSITTVAGLSWPDAGTALSLPFRGAWAAGQDADGTLYISDQDGATIWRISPAGIATIFAGTGISGSSGDNGPATQASLFQPRGLRLDGKGNLYFSDWGNNRVRKIAIATGIITRVAGSGSLSYSGDGAAATSAGLDPGDIALDSDGNLYIADSTNDRIRKVAGNSGVISTIGGNGNTGNTGDGGLATAATLFEPIGIAVDSAGVVYFSDSFNFRVRKIDQRTGIISPVAGNGTLPNAGDDGPATNAGLLIPTSLALDSSGNLLISTATNVRRVNLSSGLIQLVAGSSSQSGYAGDGGPPNQSLFNLPTYVTVAANGDVLISDFRNFRIRRIRNNVISTVAGVGIESGIPATSAFFSYPSGVVADDQGGFQVSDSGHYRVRPVAKNGTVGAGASLSGTPAGLARNGSTYFFADSDASRIYSFTGTAAPTAVAGTGTAGFSGDGGRATLARLNTPLAVAVDSQGVLYIADHCRVRMVDSVGNISTLAGTGTCGATGDGAAASLARVAPFDLALGGGSLYIADRDNHRIRKIDLGTKIITTVAGTGTAGFAGDGGPASAAQLRQPAGIAVDAGGNLYIADWGNYVVRVVRGSTITTVAGNGIDYLSNKESGAATSVSFDPLRLSFALDGSLLIVDQANGRIRRMAVSTPAALTISAGGAASGAPGAVIRLAAKIADLLGLPVAGVTVNFAVTSGTATLAATSAQTDATGIAAMNLTLGATPGPVKVTASSAGLSPVTFNVTINDAPPVTTLPSINDGGVASAGLSLPQVRALSTGAIASVFGTNFGGVAAFLKVGASDLVNGKVPTVFQGICVDVSGTRAPVFGVSNTQVNFQVPSIVAGGTVSVRVITNCGLANQQQSNAVSVTSQAAAPEFFYFSYSQDGKNPVAATDAVTSVGVAPPGLFPGSGFAAASVGQILTIYATGFGATNPPVTPGDFPPGIASATGAARVFLGGRELAASDILYAGVTPNSPGLYQLNLRVPSGTPDGNQPLVVQIGTTRSPDGPYLAVSSAAASSLDSKRGPVLLRKLRRTAIPSAEDVLGEAGGQNAPVFGR